jgi:hypothetical protein
MARTTTGIGVFFVIIGLIMMGIAFWMVFNIK